MAEKSFLLINLKDKESKKLGEVLGNPTARKILEVLAKKTYTASDLAKELTVPLPTIHYNLSNLEDAKLITADEFHYSQKGREVKHYVLANKIVIIAQEEPTPSFVEKLKKILPVAMLVGIGTTAIAYYNQIKSTIPQDTLMKAMADTAEMGIEEATDDSVRESSTIIIEQTVPAVVTEQTLLWIFATATVLTIVGYIGYETLRERWKKKAPSKK